jgi:large subunit ribosomal protein L15
MKLEKLVKLVETPKRRLGQGHGSGWVKTSGRGTKGQNARSSRSLSFEGGALPLKKRLPFLRGKNKNKVIGMLPAIINLEALNTLPKDSTVTADLLVKNGIVSAKDAKDGIKILGNGKLTVALKVTLPTSSSAAKAIEKAGGTLVR